MVSKGKAGKKGSKGRTASRSRKLVVPRGLVVAVVIVVAVVVASLPLFVYPSVSEPGELRAEPVDAVVVLGGGPGDRIGTAINLLPVLPQPPPILVLSIPYGEPLVSCGAVPGNPRVTTRCFSPSPSTTAGEAAAVAALAVEEGWDRLVVVTSDFHITRSRMLFTSCVAQLDEDVEVLWHAAPTDALSLHGSYAIATEWPSLLGTPWDHQPSCTDRP